MTKKFKGLSNTSSELHFYSDLSIEQAVHTVGNLATPSCEVTLTELDADTFGIEILEPVSYGSSRMVRTTGTLRRWEGTETRIDCNAYVGIDKQQFISTILMCVFGLAFFTAFFLAPMSRGGCDSGDVTIEEASETATSDTSTCGMNYFFIVIVLGFMLMLSIFSAWMGANYNDAASMVARDRMMQMVLKAFHDAGKVRWV